MAGHSETITVTIANGTTDAEILPPIPTYAGIPASQASTPTPNKKLMFGYTSILEVFCPATLPETITFQTDPLESGQTWYAQPSVTLGAGLAATVTTGSFKSARLHAGGAVAADRIFRVTFQYDMAT